MTFAYTSYFKDRAFYGANRDLMLFDGHGIMSTIYVYLQSEKIIYTHFMWKQNPDETGFHLLEMLPKQRHVKSVILRTYYETGRFFVISSNATLWEIVDKECHPVKAERWDGITVLNYIKNAK